MSMTDEKVARRDVTVVTKDTSLSTLMPVEYHLLVSIFTSLARFLAFLMNLEYLEVEHTERKFKTVK